MPEWLREKVPPNEDGVIDLHLLENEARRLVAAPRSQETRERIAEMVAITDKLRHRYNRKLIQNRTGR